MTQLISQTMRQLIIDRPSRIIGLTIAPPLITGNNQEFRLTLLRIISDLSLDRKTKQKYQVMILGPKWDSRNLIKFDFFKRLRLDYFKQIFNLSCLICNERYETFTSSCTTNCGHSFHQSCLDQWTQFQKGDFVDLCKVSCPVCRKGLEIKYKPSTVSNQTTPQEFSTSLTYTQVEQLNREDQVYRICIKCCTHFPAGPKSCEADRETFPNKCDGCQTEYKIIHCPKCNNGLEHNGGCLDFTCCLLGYDRCRRDKCDHGSSESITFCGHTWRLTYDDTIDPAYACGCDNEGGEDPCDECEMCNSCCDCDNDSERARCGCYDNGRCDDCRDCDDCCECETAPCGCKLSEDCGCITEAKAEAPRCKCDNSDQRVCTLCKTSSYACSKCCTCETPDLVELTTRHAYSCGCNFNLGIHKPELFSCRLCQRCLDCCKCN